MTYVQRVNTAERFGAHRPRLNGGEEARVPYTAEYFFYRAENSGGQAAQREEHGKVLERE